MTLPSFLYPLQRAILRFLVASSFTHLSLIVCAFTALRVFVALRDGIVTEGDGAPQVGATLGMFWTGELTFDEFLGGPAGSFLRQRSSQLLYPLLISLYRPLGLDITTHLLILNTALGAILIVASYFVGLRLLGRNYAALVALLICSLVGPYWIARFAVVDNAFYALIPVAALSILNWDRRRTVVSSTLMATGLGALAFTRPESILVILSVVGVLVWNYSRRSFSRFTLLTVLVLGLATVAIGSVALIGASPSLRTVLLSRAHIAWGLTGSAHTLFNREGSEFNALLAENSARQYGSANEMHYQMSMDAIATIRDSPWWYVMKVPLRGLAIMFPWTYQPWSIRHVAYEAVYTIFIVTGLALLIRRGHLGLPIMLLIAIPLSIWLFLSAYLIDNDLKHRNGMLIGLNLIAPAGYFLPRRSRSEPDFGS